MAHSHNGPAGLSDIATVQVSLWERERCVVTETEAEDRGMLACLFLNYTRGGNGDLKAERQKSCC